MTYMACCWCFGTRPKRKVVKTPKPKLLLIQDSSCNDQPSSSSANLPTASTEPEPLLTPKRRVQSFTYQQLATATNNFDPDALVGQGGFGGVYKGSLNINGQMKDVAVKTLDRSGFQGEREFLVEALMLSTLRDKNLVKLYGYCKEGDHRSLVYKYMPLGSVEDRIHNFNSVGEVLDLSTRMKIALGAAKGLAYLHNEAEPNVIYRDMKTSNILLDDGFKPKLSDFGLAKLGPGKDRSHVTTRVMGTHGYCAPEYAATGKLTLMSDIYSFGVVILELITGRKPVGDSSMGAERLLVNWALPHFMNLNIRKITDPMLAIQGHPYLEEAVRRGVELAYTCLREDAKGRPKISEVVGALEVIVEYIERNQKGKMIRYGRGVGKGKKVEGSVSSPKRMLTIHEREEEDEGVKRERELADAKTWAEGLRDKRTKGKAPLKLTP